MHSLPDSVAGVGIPTLQRCSAFLMVIGPGSATAFYMAMVGFYYLNFDSRLFFIGMLFSLYLPYVFLISLQHFLDFFFDERFSTKTTYFFRVIFLQFILGLVGLAWMFAPQTPRIVLCFGAILGTVSAAILSSSFQMVTAMNPELIIYAHVGEQVGGILPIVTFAILGFEASSSLQKFNLALSMLPLVCTFAAAILSYVHFNTGLFEKAYQRLSYIDDPDILAEYGSEGVLRFDRSFSEAGHDPESARHGVPTWVWWWCACTGVMTIITSCVLSLMPFYEDPFMAQRLALWKLGMDFMGRTAAVPLNSLTCFKSGPWHRVLLALAFVHVCSASFPLAKLANIMTASVPYLIMWCVFNGIYRFSCSFSAVTMVSYLQSKDRKLVARTHLVVLIGSFLAGLVVALAVVQVGKGLDGKWPDMDKLIK